MFDFAQYFAGHIVVELQMIFRIVPSVLHPQIPGGDRLLTYVKRFDVIPQTNCSVSGSRMLRGSFPEPASSLYILTRARRTDDTLIGDILPLDQIRAFVSLTPRFGAQADRRLTQDNSMAHSSEYFLNKYFNKELFFPLTLHVD